MDKDIQIDTFCRFTQVSRETITSLKKYENLLISANQKLKAIKEYIKVVKISHNFDRWDLSEILPKIGLSTAATRLETPMVHVQYNVPISWLGANTSTKYLAKIKVIIIADQAELAQS